MKQRMLPPTNPESGQGLTQYALGPMITMSSIVCGAYMLVRVVGIRWWVVVPIAAVVLIAYMSRHRFSKHRKRRG